MTRSAGLLVPRFWAIAIFMTIMNMLYGYYYKFLHYIDG